VGTEAGEESVWITAIESGGWETRKGVAIYVFSVEVDNRTTGHYKKKIKRDAKVNKFFLTKRYKTKLL